MWKADGPDTLPPACPQMHRCESIPGRQVHWLCRHRAGRQSTRHKEVELLPPLFDIDLPSLHERPTFLCGIELDCVRLVKLVCQDDVDGIRVRGHDSCLLQANKIPHRSPQLSRGNETVPFRRNAPVLIRCIDSLILRVLISQLHRGIKKGTDPPKPKARPGAKAPRSCRGQS
jgi:hypothetical protein